MTRRAARLVPAVLLLALLHGAACSPGPCPDRRMPALTGVPCTSPCCRATGPDPLPSVEAPPFLEGLTGTPERPGRGTEPTVAAVWEALAMPALEGPPEARSVVRAGYLAAAGSGEQPPEAAELRVRGRGADYRWLAGRLHYAQVRGVWCLRYAAEEEEDRYGGRVTLVGLADLAGLRDGQLVRVEGRLADPASWEPSPPYEVSAVQFLTSGR